MIRTLLFLVAIVAACSSSNQQLTCSGKDCTCAGGTCDTTCSGGSCSYKCENGADCTFHCPGGSCSAERRGRSMGFGEEDAQWVSRDQKVRPTRPSVRRTGAARSDAGITDRFGRERHRHLRPASERRGGVAVPGGEVDQFLSGENNKRAFADLKLQAARVLIVGSALDQSSGQKKPCRRSLTWRFPSASELDEGDASTQMRDGSQ